MDVQLIASAVLDLPSSQRVDAIVHDGTSDLRARIGPGPDRDLVERYGSALGPLLDRERQRLPGGELAVGDVLRLHRGNLHCDFLLWVATRAPERRGVPSKAPDASVIERAVKAALTFASERDVARIAFGALGGGPEALGAAARLEISARAAIGFEEERYRAGRPAGIEDVLICHPHSSQISAARRRLGRSVKLIEERPPPPAPAPPKRARRSRGARKTSPRAGARAKEPLLSPQEVSSARATAAPYDRARTYEVGHFMVHSKFGVGRVDEITREGFIMVLFEGGARKRLLHGRP